MISSEKPTIGPVHLDEIGNVVFPQMSVLHGVLLARSDYEKLFRCLLSNEIIIT